VPSIVVNIAWPGASPEQLESEVARKVEDAVANLSRLKHIHTTVSSGNAIIVVEFELDKDIIEATDDVRNAVTSIRGDLPVEIQEPIISKTFLSGAPVVTYSITSKSMDEIDLSWFVDNTVNKALMSVKGVGQVRRIGGLNREVRVELNTAQMTGLGVTAADVSRALRSVQQDSPGGRAQISAQEQSIRVLAAAASADDIRNLEIPLSIGSSVRLGDVANVIDGASDRSSDALVNGETTMVFDVTRSKNGGEIAILENVRIVMEEFKKDHPNVTITEVSDTVKPIQDNYNDSMFLLVEGAILATLVVWWFLRDWRATLVSAVALPLSIIPTFWFMDLMGFSLNVVTLLSLSLVIGVLVDDAIVEVENIVRHMNMGKSAFQAAMEGADEIGVAVIATSLTLVAVFLPTAFMGGIPGKFFVQFGWTAAIAVLVSLLVARLLTPMMAAYLLKKGDHHEVKDSKFMTLYMKTVRWCLTHPWLTTLYSAIFFFGSLGIASTLPGEFIPQGDISRTAISVELPPGYTMEQTKKVAEQARLAIKDTPEITSIYTSVGIAQTTDPFAPVAAGEVRKATLNIMLTPRGERSRTQPEIEAEFREKVQHISGARFTFGSVESSSYYVVTLSGDDAQALDVAANKIEREIRTIKGIGTVNSSASVQTPEISIVPDLAKAAAAGISTVDLANTIRIATSGDYQQSLSKLNLPDRQVPINVSMTSTERSDLSDIENLKIRSNTGELVPLSAVAQVKMGTGPTTISRLDRQRNINFTIEPNGIPLGELGKQVYDLPSVKALSKGMKLKELGDAEASAELAISFMFAMAAGIGAIYIILILLFHNFTQPMTILAALPLSAGGAFGALYISQFSLSMPAMIGLIMLMGIVTKNSILLVDYAIMAYRTGLSRTEAILDACHKRSRPIVMTTIAMAAGMLPNALGLGADPSFRAPMAVVVIGGLITSTFLSLLVIPVVYIMLDDAQNWVMGKLRRKPIGSAEHADTAMH
jgi:multidrug efflux pump subunit AcrB